MAAVSLRSRPSQFLLPFSVTNAENTHLRISLTFNKRISHPRRILLAQAKETATSIFENETEEAVKPQPIGPKKGTKVRILREESYWYNGIGSVVAVDQDPAAQYPVIVRFNNASYANVSTNNYALDEIVEVN